MKVRVKLAKRVAKAVRRRGRLKLKVSVVAISDAGEERASRKIVVTG